MLHGQKLATIKLCAGLAAMTCLSFGPCLQKVQYGFVTPLASRSIKGNFLDVKFIFNLTRLINMIALLILRIHNYTSIQWHFILCIGNASYDCSQVICELRYVIMQLVHLAGHSSMNLRNRQPKNTDLPPSRTDFITFLRSLLFCLLHHESTMVSMHLVSAQL